MTKSASAPPGSKSGIKHFDDLKTKEYAFGATGPTEEAVQIYKTMNALLGTKIRTVSGYPGGNQINLAIERGEIHGRCALSWSSVKATLQHWLDEKKLVRCCRWRPPSTPTCRTFRC